MATLREREPAMKALAKRVAQRGTTAVLTPGAVADDAEKDFTGIVTSTHSKEGHERGPRNQPKRRSRRR